MTCLEVAVTTLADAQQAAAGGANSIEISIDLAQDGLTPPPALVQSIRAQVRLPLHVILRPHAHDFVYTPAEQQHILAQAAQMLLLGVDGLVIGGLRPDGTLDVDLIRQVAAVAPAAVITLHRALDHCVNPLPALDALRGTVQRVLASGSAPEVDLGRDTLRQWVQACPEYHFVAAGRVRLATAADLVAFTGVHAVHTASAVMTAGRVDADKVRALRDSLSGPCAPVGPGRGHL